MTNEEIAVQIQQGHYELLPVLWDNVKYLLFKILKNKMYNRSLPNYIDYDDLKQHMYFAMCTAVKYYNSEKSYKFTTYLNYAVLHEFGHILTHNSKELQECSYNSYINEDETTELAELLEDKAAKDWLFEIENNELVITLQNAINKLPENEKQVIKQHFYLKRTHKEISNSSGITENEVYYTECRALKRLRNDKTLQKFYFDFTNSEPSKDYKEHLINQKWKLSEEYKQAKEKIKSLKQNSVEVSHGEEQTIFLIHKQRYLSKHNDNI
jgi:RNA polymerase sigma factor (sigma-70 family)